MGLIKDVDARARVCCYDDPVSNDFHLKPGLFFKSERVFIVTIAILFECVNLSVWSSLTLLLCLTGADGENVLSFHNYDTLSLGRARFSSPECG